MASDLQTIAQLAKETAAGLAESYFGERIKDLRDELTALRAELADLEGQLPDD